MIIKFDPQILAELEYLVELINANNGSVEFDNVEQLVSYVMFHIADGSRRPGSWERGLLQSLGLVSDAPEHHVYRGTYGKPEGEGESP